MSELNRRKVCFFTYNLFDLGGIQRVVTVLASALTEDYDVYIQCYDAPEKENRSLYGLSDAVKVIYADRNNRTSSVRKLLRKINQKSAILERINRPRLFEYAYLLPEEQKLYKKIIDENKIDIAIGVGAFESYLLGSIRSQIDCKAIGWQHNSYKAYYETKGLACWGMGYIIDKYFPLLDLYVVLNEYDEKEFQEKRNFRCKTIHNPKSFVCDQRADLQNKKFIAAGRFIYAKGFDYLIEAFREFAQYDKEWTLDIYGTGELENEVRAKIEEYKLTDRIFLKGFSDKMVDNLLDSSCYLLSSRWEGMPMVILEALEVGVPVVSFNISAMLPLVSNEVEGLLVKQFDCSAFAKAMLTIASNEKMRKEMGQAAKIKAKSFSVEIIVEKWKNVLKSI